MVRTVGIKYGGQTGTIKYDAEDLKHFEVDFPDDDKEGEIVDYLTTRRDFHIPESQRIDDYRIDRALPTDHVTYFELALCTLHANTEVWVDW